MKLKIGSAVVTLIAAGLLLEVTGPYGQPIAEKGTEGRVVMAEIEITPHGTFGATLNSDSSVHGQKQHTRDDATFSRMYAKTFVMQKGERLTLFLTAAAAIEPHRRTLTCRIKDQGKTVRSDELTVRANEPGKAIGCDLTIYN